MSKYTTKHTKHYQEGFESLENKNKKLYKGGPNEAFVNAPSRAKNSTFIKLTSSLLEKRGISLTKNKLTRNEYILSNGTKSAKFEPTLKSVAVSNFELNDEGKADTEKTTFLISQVVEGNAIILGLFLPNGTTLRVLEPENVEQLVFGDQGYRGDIESWGTQSLFDIILNSTDFDTYIDNLLR